MLSEDHAKSLTMNDQKFIKLHESNQYPDVIAL